MKTNIRDYLYNKSLRDIFHDITLLLVYGYGIYLFVYYFLFRIIIVYYQIKTPNLNNFFYSSLKEWFLYIFILYLFSLNKYFASKYMKTIVVLFLIVYILNIYYFYQDIEYITYKVILFQKRILYDSLFTFFIGVMIYRTLNNNLKYLLFTMWLVLTGIIIMHTDFTTLTMNPSKHQLFGDVYVILSILVIFSIFKTIKIRTIVLFIAFCLLYIISSRASFYSFFLIYLLFLIKEYPFKYIVYLFLSFFIVLIVLFISNDINISGRMIGIRPNGNFQDGIYERIMQFQYGINSIKENWFFGDYAGQALVYDTGYRSGHIGAYMHNWLSFWRQYGLVFFTIFTILYAYGLYYFTIKWKKSKDYIVDIIFYLSIFMLISLLFMRSYNNLFVWLVLGMMYVYIEINQKNNIEKNGEINGGK